jgi:hypothetical protein
VLGLVVALWLATCLWWPGVLTLLGIDNLGAWFIDTWALLVGSDAHVLGFKPSDPNPLDLFHQPYVYPDFWFVLSRLSLHRGDYLWLGAAMAGAFLILALLQVRVRTWSEWALAIAVLCSPPIVFALTRGNIDLVVFAVLSALVPCLLARAVAARYGAILVVALAAAMKLYPAIAALVLLAPTRPRRERLLQLALAAVALAVVGITEADSLGRYGAMPHPLGFWTFGFDIAPRLLHWGAGAKAIAAGMLALVAGVIAGRLPAPPAATSDAQRSYLGFMVGATLLVGCYFAAINYAYRAVFAVWMMPFLWHTCADPERPTAERRAAAATLVLLLILLWYDGICCLVINTTRRLSVAEVNLWTDRLILVRSPLHALLVVVLLAYVLAFVRHALRPAQTRAPTPSPALS